MTLVTTRHQFRLACASCYGTFPVAVTVRYRPGVYGPGVRPEDCVLSCTLDPADQVMVRLWADAHRGPFTKVR